MNIVRNSIQVNKRPLRVVIVDDSASVRRALETIFAGEPDIQVVHSAVDGQHGLRVVAKQALQAEPIDVVLLDIEMPVMDGLTALSHFTSIDPSPKIIMASSLTKRGAAASLRALTMGASDYLCKPKGNSEADNQTFKIELLSKVRCWGAAARRLAKDKSGAISQSKQQRSAAIVDAPPSDHNITESTTSENKRKSGKNFQISDPRSLASRPNHSANEPTHRARPAVQDTIDQTRPVDARTKQARSDGQVSRGERTGISPRIAKKTIDAIAIGGSTGAPQALHTLFQQLQSITTVPIFITQHMPASFTTILAEQLSKTSGKICQEGSDEEIVEPNRVYIAPGDFHMSVVRDSSKIKLRVQQGEPENFCRPAVDPMFRSLAKCYQNRLLVILLTGMGQDGLIGCHAVSASKGTIIAQDEQSSVVWGMPGSVVRAGIADLVLPLDDIASHICSIVRGD